MGNMTSIINRANGDASKAAAQHPVTTPTMTPPKNQKANTGSAWSRGPGAVVRHTMVEHRPPVSSGIFTSEVHGPSTLVKLVSRVR
jgi:hypothetical protein